MAPPAVLDSNKEIGLAQETRRTWVEQPTAASVQLDDDSLLGVPLAHRRTDSLGSTAKFHFLSGASKRHPVAPAISNHPDSVSNEQVEQVEHQVEQQVDQVGQVDDAEGTESKSTESLHAALVREIEELRGREVEMVRRVATAEAGQQQAFATARRYRESIDVLRRRVVVSERGRMAGDERARQLESRLMAAQAEIGRQRREMVGFEALKRRLESERE